MTGPTLDTVPAGPAPAHRVTFTGAEVRGGADGPGRVPSCVLDLLDLPDIDRDSGQPGRVLLVGPHQDAVVLRLTAAGYLVDVQLRGIEDAEAAAERLPDGVGIRCGSLRGTTGDYDTVIALGGLAYLSTGDAPVDDWADAIDLLAARVAPGGRLAVLVRSDFGLDRLTSATIAGPGHRVDAYAADRRALDRQLAGVGLRCDVDYAAYPDVTAPEVLVSRAAFGTGGQTVGTLIAAAYRSRIVDPYALTDPRPLARDSAGHGLGPALAPGWLIVARRTTDVGAADEAAAAPGTVLVADARTDEFRSAPHLVLAQPDGSWIRRRLAGGPVDEERHGGLIRDAARLDGPVPAGSLLEERLIALAGAHDVAAARDLIVRFGARLAVPDGSEATMSSATPSPTDLTALDNLIDAAELSRLDPSWRVEPAVTGEVAFVAALYRFADRLLAAALPHPWASAQSPGKLAARLASMAGLVVPPDLLVAAADHADRIASAIDGRPVDEPVAIESGHGGPVAEVVVGPVVPITPIVRPIGVAEAARTIEAITAELAATHDQLALLTATIADLDKRLAKAIRKTNRIESSRVYQIARLAAKPLRAARKAVRSARKR